MILVNGEIDEACANNFDGVYGRTDAHTYFFGLIYTILSRPMREPHYHATD